MVHCKAGAWLALCSLLVAASSFVDGQSCSAASSGLDGKRIWTIATGHDWGAYEYFDRRGYISGFSSEIINAVCTAAGMECRIIWDKYTNCWDSEAGEHPSPGKGLMGRWYDACTGWGVTVERMHAYDFTLPYLAATQTYFFVKANRSPALNIADLSTYTIAFFDGWYSDEKCLARQGNDQRQNYILRAEQIRHVISPSEVIPLLQSGEVDAVFAGAQDLDQFVESGQIERVPTPFSCVLGGHGMMTRKDSDFASHWNRGFQKIRSNGQFFKLCEDAANRHAEQGTIHCSD